MEDLTTEAGVAMRNPRAGLPDTLEEARRRAAMIEREQLAASIERAVQRETAYGVRDLSVAVDRNGVQLNGHCSTYYCKQLAQHAAMGVPGGDRLTNAIEVC